MKTIKIQLYKFEELSEAAQKKAIQLNYEFNIYFEWWDNIYYDAKEVGLKITCFDIDRGSNCSGEFIYSATECANYIIKQHGKNCDSYNTANEFLTDYNLLVEKYSDGINKNIVAEDNEYNFDNEADELEEDFLKSLLEDYLSILRNEYEYLTSEEAIKEALIANEYDFTKNGNKY